MTKKIAILGSCVSEDWYHFQDVHARLDAVVPMRYQLSSLISIMAEPVRIDVEIGDNLKRLEKVSLQMDFDKSFLRRLIELKPDVLIVELLADGRDGNYGGVIEADGSWISSTYILTRTPMHERFSASRHLDIFNDPDEYIALFRQSAKRLQEFLARELPDCKVILNQARWAEYFVDEHGNVHSYSPWEQNSYLRYNFRVDLLEKIFTEEVRCDVLRIDEVPIFADVQHIWGRSADHYVRYFYTSFTRKLGELMHPSSCPTPVQSLNAQTCDSDSVEISPRERESSGVTGT